MTLFPWLLPALAATVVLSLLLGRAAARWLHAPLATASLVLMSTGCVLAATLVPLPGASGAGAPVIGCDLGRTGLAPAHELLEISDTSLNILLFVPMGLAIGLLPASRRSVSLGLSGLALPVAIEGTQWLVPALGRSCQSADVVDNATGYLVGLGIAGAWAGISRLARRGVRDRPDGPGGPAPGDSGSR